MFQILHSTDPSDPAFHTALLLGVALACICLRRYRWASAFSAFGIAWILLCATPAFAAWLRSGLENPYPARQASTYPAADAIVVLGGGDPPDFGRGVGTEQTTRAGFALELYRQTRVPIILFSGGAGEATEMAQQLEQQGVPAQSLRIEPASATTYQNAAYSAPLLEREHLHRILLVTSAVPMRRAAACFEHLGFDVIPAPAIEATQTPAVNATWLPQRAVLLKSQRYLHEYIGMMVYEMRGWI